MSSGKTLKVRSEYSNPVMCKRGQIVLGCFQVTCQGLTANFFLKFMKTFPLQWSCSYLTTWVKWSLYCGYETVYTPGSECLFKHSSEDWRKFKKNFQPSCSKITQSYLICCPGVLLLQLRYSSCSRKQCYSSLQNRFSELVLFGGWWLIEWYPEKCHHMAQGCWETSGG